MRVFVNKTTGQKEVWYNPTTETKPTGTVEGIYAVEEGDLAINEKTFDAVAFNGTSWEE